LYVEHKIEKWIYSNEEEIIQAHQQLNVQIKKFEKFSGSVIRSYLLYINQNR